MDLQEFENQGFEQHSLTPSLKQFDFLKGRVSATEYTLKVLEAKLEKIEVFEKQIYDMGNSVASAKSSVLEQALNTDLKLQAFNDRVNALKQNLSKIEMKHEQMEGQMQKTVFELVEFRKSISEDQIRGLFDVNKKIRNMHKQLSNDLIELQEKTVQFTNPSQRIDELQREINNQKLAVQIIGKTVETQGIKSALKTDIEKNNFEVQTQMNQIQYNLEMLRCTSRSTEVYLDRYLPCKFLNMIKISMEDALSTYEDKKAFNFSLSKQFNEIKEKIQKEEEKDSKLKDRKLQTCSLNKIAYFIPNIDILPTLVTSSSDSDDEEYSPDTNKRSSYRGGGESDQFQSEDIDFQDEIKDQIRAKMNKMMKTNDKLFENEIIAEYPNFDFNEEEESEKHIILEPFHEGGNSSDEDISYRKVKIVENEKPKKDYKRSSTTMAKVRFEQDENEKRQDKIEKKRSNVLDVPKQLNLSKNISVKVTKKQVLEATPQHLLADTSKGSSSPGKSPGGISNGRSPGGYSAAKSPGGISAGKQNALISPSQRVYATQKSVSGNTALSQGVKLSVKSSVSKHKTVRIEKDPKKDKKPNFKSSKTKPELIDYDKIIKKNVLIGELKENIKSTKSKIYETQNLVQQQIQDNHDHIKADYDQKIENLTMRCIEIENSVKAERVMTENQMGVMQVYCHENLEKECLKINERFCNIEKEIKKIKQNFEDYMDQLKNINFKMGRQHADNIKQIEKYANKFGLNDPLLSNKVSVAGLNKLMEMILQHLMINNMVQQPQSVTVNEPELKSVNQKQMVYIEFPRASECQFQQTETDERLSFRGVSDRPSISINLDASLDPVNVGFQTSRERKTVFKNGSNQNSVENFDESISSPTEPEVLSPGAQIYELEKLQLRGKTIIENAWLIHQEMNIISDPIETNTIKMLLNLQKQKQNDQVYKYMSAIRPKWLEFDYDAILSLKAMILYDEFKHQKEPWIVKHINQDLRSKVLKKEENPIRIKPSNVVTSQAQTNSRIQKLEAMTRHFNASNLSYKQQESFRSNILTPTSILRTRNLSELDKKRKNPSPARLKKIRASINVEVANKIQFQSSKEIKNINGMFSKMNFAFPEIKSPKN